MFRKSITSSQLNLFSNTQSFLRGSSLKVYENDQSWHNQFRLQVTDRIEEEMFRVLFRDDFGAPNSPIRVLVSMMILKEGKGWSDSQLFEHCRFNLLVRSALGFLNMDDAIPAESTYYLFRKRIVEFENSGGDNLIEKTFSQVTQSQSLTFNVCGKNIRMDSKLLGSNIAWYSRYELIHETLRKAYRSVIQKDLSRFSLSESDISMLERISGETGDKVSYRSSKTEIESQLAQIGVVIYKIVGQTGNHPSEVMQNLVRVFNEQYAEKESVVIPRPKEEIIAGSVQSPHDTDCHYRKKDEQQVKGYSINITETCNAARPYYESATESATELTPVTDTTPSLNLITSVLVDVASAADSHFLQPAIEASREVVTGTIETVNADGAYHSVDNQDYCRKQETPVDLVLGAIQGKASQYDLSLDDEGQLLVTDLTTNTLMPVRQVESRKEDASSKWAIKNEKGKYRYFTQKEIDTCLLRKKIGIRTQAELNVRNNVEATIFQLGFHYSNAKSRYRGLIKHKMWANVRCLWINFVRINNFVAGGGSYGDQIGKNNGSLSYFCTQIEKGWMNWMYFLRFFINPFKTINIISQKSILLDW